jgi:uncharacterized protein (PEP-CTERM system associated)
VPRLIQSRVVGGTERTWNPPACATAILVVVGLGCAIAAAPALAENWRFSASATATETYTSNVNYTTRSLAEGDFATALNATLNVDGEGARLKLRGSIGATGTFYVKETENNSFAPSVNLAGTLEAIEKFAYLDAQAFVSQTFSSPFSAQPANLVNATQNRYTQQTYSVSPYIRGVFGSSNVSYQLRDDNFWTFASGFGNSSTNVPNTYSNNLNALLSSPANPWGWTLSYSRTYYNNGITIVDRVANDSTTDAATTYNNLLATLDYQIDPQLLLSLRAGYQSYTFAAPSLQEGSYGIGIQWSPTDRTHVGGFWDHTFYGSSYSVQISHRLPNAALSANLSRGVSSFPELAVAIPAGAAVAQFLNAAFTTRIQDPAERAQAVEQFLARTQLPPTLASPVNYYATSLTLQEAANLSLVLVGTRNSVGLSVFYLKNEAISGQGNVLPPALQFGQNNTQTGVGVNYSFSLSPLTNVGASASYSMTTVDTSTGPFANARSNNANANVNLGTRFGPKTSGSAGVGYSWYGAPGGVITGNTSALNVFATVSHTF